MPPTPHHGPGPLGILAAIAALVLASAGCQEPDPLQDIRANLAAGHVAASIEPLRLLLEERPGDAEINYYYGRALTMAGQPTLAEWSLRKAMEDPEWRLYAAMQLAAAALSSKGYPTAFEALGVVLEAEPDNIGALLMRANARTHSKTDHAGALADAERIFELDPNHLDAYEPKVLALIGLERYAEVGETIEALGQAMDKVDLEDDRYAWHCVTLAIFANDNQQPELAQERWTGCLEKYPADSGVVWPAIKFFDDRRDFARSLETVRSAFAAAPHDHSYLTALAARLRHAGKNEEAESTLAAATESEEASLQLAAWLELVVHYRATDNYEKSAEAAENAIELARAFGEPTPQMLLDYADALLLASKFDGALAAADQIEISGYSEMIRARVAQARGDPSMALEHFDKAFLLWPNNPWARYMAAAAAEAVGDFDRALEEYRYSIRIDPGATRARVDIARLMLAEDRADEALQLLRLKTNEYPLDLEGELLSLQAFARVGDSGRVRQHLRLIAKAQPEALGRAVAAAAKGVHRLAGPAAALPLLRTTPGLDLTSPVHADALRTLVQHSSEEGRLKDAVTTLGRALGEHPNAAVLHEIRGLALALDGQGAESIRQAHDRALELDPDHARSLSALGRLTGAADPDGALSLFDHAVTADPDWPEPRIAAAELLIVSGRLDEAESRLVALLVDQPYEAKPALLLAQIRLDRGEVDEQTLQLARRAVRFKAGQAADRLLEQIESARATTPSRSHLSHSLDGAGRGSSRISQSRPL